jgi:predicted Fe-Mo cluster-binding NifX family protein
MSLKRIVVACEGNGLEGDVCGHFGHAPAFLVAETEGDRILSTKLVPAPEHGAVCSMPEFVHRLGAQAVVVGGMGARAQAMLAGLGVAVYGGVSGNAGAALRAVASGELRPAEATCGGHHDTDHTCGHHH